MPLLPLFCSIKEGMEACGSPSDFMLVCGEKPGRSFRLSPGNSEGGVHTGCLAVATAS